MIPTNREEKDKHSNLVKTKYRNHKIPEWVQGPIDFVYPLLKFNRMFRIELLREGMGVDIEKKN
jgi:hypothetical protein